MDDIHFGGDTVEEVVKMQNDLVDFFRSGGWEILKFASNSAEVYLSFQKNKGCLI